MHRHLGNVRNLATAPLGPLLVRYSWPALVSMALNALYAVVDRFYIGQGCGSDAMAGMTLAMPVMMLFGAFGVWIGAGHSAVLSIKLGEGDRDTCERCLGELVAFKLLFFLVLTPLVFLNIDTVLGWCGGAKVTPRAFAEARRYLQIVLFSHVFSHLAFGFSAMMRAEGAAVRSMTCMIVGFGANLLLDPVFIFGFGMGMAGAAWATNIAMVLSCVWAASYYLRGRSAVRLAAGRIRFYRALAARTMSVGLAPFLQQLMTSVICSALPAAFAHWAPDEKSATAQIASLGVFHAALALTIMPVMGCQQGLAPIIGYNWGARNYRRVYGAFLLGFWVTTALCVTACVVQVVPPFPGWIARIFVGADQPDLIRLAAHDLTVSNCMLWMISVNVVSTTYFQAIGRPKAAILLSMLRQGVILLPCIFLLPHFIEDRMFAIWLALPVSDVICQIATLPPFLLHLRFLRRIRHPADRVARSAVADTPCPQR